MTPDHGLRFTGILPNIGAEVTGLDPTRPIGQADAQALREGLHRYKVLVLRGHALTKQQHVDFGRVFGEPEVHPAYRDPDVPEILNIRAHPGTDEGSFKENRLGFWHTDVTYQQAPPSAAVLCARHLPARGGGTAFVNTAVAHECLDDRTKAEISGLRAIHDPRFELQIDDPARVAELRAANPAVVHPVVTTHPVTGEQILFVNEYFTVGIEGLDDADGRRLLERLCAHLQKPEFQLRVDWMPDTLVAWDERATQHYAIKDFEGPRHLDRVTLVGTVPLGPRDPDVERR